MPQFVDWDNPRLLPAPRQSQPTKLETHYLVACPCGYRRWLTRCNAERAEQEGLYCKFCQRSEAGKKGWATTIARYGLHFGLEKRRKAELAHQSSSERIVKDWLDKLCVSYVHQQIFIDGDFGVVIDFVIENRLAVEVNGYWHKRRRALRDAALAEKWPLARPDGVILFLDAEEIDARPVSAQACLTLYVESIHGG
jgi:hypothetical protein